MIDDLTVVERENLGWDKRIRSFTASNLVDLFVITTERYLIVLDTGNAPEQMQDIMKRVEDDLKGRQLLVINSHQHFDHVWGNVLFTTHYPAPIIGHQKSLETATDAEAKNYLAEQQASKPFFANVQLVAPTFTFSQNFTVHGGDLTLFLFPTPGHSSDHISVWIPEIETLLATDTAEHPIPYAAVGDANLPFPYGVADGSVEQLERDLRLLKSFKPKTVLPCHGGTVEPALLDRNLHYFKTLRQKINAARPGSNLKPEEVPENIAWTFEIAMQDLGLTGDFGEFYRGSHIRNIQGIIRETRSL
jgi:glyoxylase-like metal-dependent hydrolase (beta-lactamase superfamily II)